MSDELVKQLRKDADFVDAVTYDGCWEIKETERGQRLRAAASRIEALESRQRVLREALEPFARSSERDWDDDAPDDTEVWNSQGYGWPTSQSSFNVGDLRRARRALAGDAG